MLNMWQNGFKNTLCIFGTTNFGKEKVKLLDNLGIVSVNIMMDGDLAGKTAAKKIKKLLEDNDIHSTIITLPVNKDPGELSAHEISFLIEQGQ